MKTKSIILTMAAAALLASSCDKYLDTGLDINNTSETVATSRSSLWSFANAFYTPIIYGYSVIDSNIFASASDEAQQTSASSNVIYFNKGIVNASVNPLWTYYNNCYEGIRAANFFLDYVADGKGMALLELNRNLITDAVGYARDVASLNHYIAEAHVARAYYYSELIKMFGGVPIVEKTQEQSGGEKVARSSYDRCVDYIVSEIDAWKDKLAENWNDDNTREGRFTLGAALAIKARTLLYAASPLHNPSGDWDKWNKAAQAAADVINLGTYSLDPDYGAYFRGGNSLSSAESIYIVRRAASNTMETNNYPIATSGGKSGVCPTENLVSAYEWTGTPDESDPYANRDPRLAASIVVNGSSWNGRVIAQAAGETDDMARANASRTGYYLKKFLTDDLNLTQGATAQHNWVAYRYGEVLLNYAEAVNEAYGPSSTPAGFPMSAKQALQMVRNRAGASLPAVTASTVDSFRDAVKHERRVELAFEDHRYWDLLRWKDAMTVLNQPVNGVKITRSGAVYTYTVRKVADRTFNERNYYLPFLRSEIENSAGTLEQNPGY
ncbi:MAG: RagB/SusD family nutrient uptake outer membrane protein [Bacteroidales bacterium]|nr:RagB/SusD family nutrient uptake outer membrane protein [Bacteroidales bacterium]